MCLIVIWNLKFSVGSSIFLWKEFQNWGTTTENSVILVLYYVTGPLQLNRREKNQDWLVLTAFALICCVNSVNVAGKNGLRFRISCEFNQIPTWYEILAQTMCPKLFCRCAYGWQGYHYFLTIILHWLTKSGVLVLVWL